MSLEEKAALDRWTVECAVALQVSYGHSFGTAWLLAAYSRDMLRESLEKPLSPFIVTGF